MNSVPTAGDIHPFAAFARKLDHGECRNPHESGIRCDGGERGKGPAVVVVVMDAVVEVE